MNAPERELLYLLAYVFIQNAQSDRAAILLRALDAITPDQALTLRALGVALLRSGHAEDALEILDRLAMTGATDAAFHLLRAQALEALGQREAASAAMRAYVDARTGRPDVLTNGRA